MGVVNTFVYNHPRIHTVPMSVFKSQQIALEFDSSVPFKKKTQLKKNVIDNGGIVSFIVTKKSTHLVVNNAEKAQDSYKSRMAQKWGIPVVDVSFIDACIEANKLLEPDQYIVVGKTAGEEFSTGKIIASMSDKMKSDHKKKRERSNININQVKLYNWPHSVDVGNVPEFSEKTYEVVRHAFLKKFDSKTRLTSFVAMEIHVTPSNECPLYRVFVHRGFLERKSKDGELGMCECRYVATPLDVEAVYSYLYRQYTSSPHNMERVQFLSSHVGSPGLRKIVAEACPGGGVKGEKLHPLVCGLVEYMWSETIGELENVLCVPVETIKLDQVEKAEAALLTIKRLLDNDKSSSQEEIAKYSKEFDSCIPNTTNTLINTKRMISERQQLCQLIRDVVGVNESTNWSQRTGTAAKYHALRCGVTPLDPTTEEYNDIQDHILSSQDSSLFSTDGDLSVEIVNIYSVHRAVEDSNFTHSIDNKQLLFHSSATQNFVGILSRGLLLPKIVVDDLGGTRSDPGMLGSGIYFTDSATLSAKYSKPGKMGCKNRFMLVNQVALGNVKDFSDHQKNLSAPPEGYNSVKGMRSTDEEPSEFKANEYVVYQTGQQRIRYLVEFKTALDNDTETESIIEVTEDEQDSVESVDDQTADENNDVTLSDVKDVTDPLSKVEAGLKVEGADVPLQAVHIRAQLIDLAAKVVVLQSYKNNSTIPIEAKYVFPLDDMAAVCGFEAFINGKHIIGEVKEKEQAHREYKQAIKEGHGAYLMDEETPDVFTVSVGNLPPGASVLIKITYVSELQVEGENIVFALPGSVAPWKKEAALDETTQSDVEKIKVRDAAKKCSVQVSVEMPFNINTIESPTHKIKMKKTSTKATVEVCPGEKIESGFQLLVGLSEIHVPRMWVEEDDKEHHACMLTFYPEFEAEAISENEIVIMLDLSNSMKGDALNNAKKVIFLLLHHLPPRTYFNIVTFGAMFDTLFPSSVPVNKDSLTSARKFIQKCQANLGSTDLWKPLHSLQLLSTSNEGINTNNTLPPRSVFVISDGHMTEEAPTLTAIRDGLKSSRVFTFGVSSSANRHFLRSIAHVGGGREEFFEVQKKSNWERKIKSQLSKAFQPALTGVSVDWLQHDENAPTPIQAPKEIVSLFSGSRLVVYGFVPHCKQATLKACIGRKEISTMVSTSDLAMTNGKTLHQLTARAIIRDWSEGSLDSDRTQHEIAKRDMKSFIINTSINYSIVSQFTSFVAIEKREKDDIFVKDSGPTIDLLVTKEKVDKLEYMGWELDQGADPVQDAIDSITDSIAKMAAVTDQKVLETKYKEVWTQSEDVLQPSHPERLKVLDRLVNNYIKQKKFKEGREFLSPVIDKLMVIGADHSAMMRVELLMHNIKEEETALRRAEEQKQRMLEEAKQRKAKEFKERMEMVKREREKAKEELMQVSKPMVVEKFVSPPRPKDKGKLTIRGKCVPKQQQPEEKQESIYSTLAVITPHSLKVSQPPKEIKQHVNYMKMDMFKIQQLSDCLSVKLGSCKKLPPLSPPPPGVPPPQRTPPPRGGKRIPPPQRPPPPLLNGRFARALAGVPPPPGGPHPPPMKSAESPHVLLSEKRRRPTCSSRQISSGYVDLAQTMPESSTESAIQRRSSLVSEEELEVSEYVVMSQFDSAESTSFETSISSGYLYDRERESDGRGGRKEFNEESIHIVKGTNICETLRGRKSLVSPPYEKKKVQRSLDLQTETKTTTFMAAFAKSSTDENMPKLKSKTDEIEKTIEELEIVDITKGGDFKSDKQPSITQFAHERGDTVFRRNKAKPALKTEKKIPMYTDTELHVLGGKKTESEKYQDAWADRQQSDYGKVLRRSLPSEKLAAEYTPVSPDGARAFNRPHWIANDSDGLLDLCCYSMSEFAYDSDSDGLLDLSSYNMDDLPSSGTFGIDNSLNEYTKPEVLTAKDHTLQTPQAEQYQTLLLNSESEFKRLSKEPQKIEDDSEYKPVPKMRLAYNGKKKSERLQTFSSEFMLFNEPVMLEEKAQDQPRDKEGSTVHRDTSDMRLFNRLNDDDDEPLDIEDELIAERLSLISTRSISCSSPILEIYDCEKKTGHHSKGHYVRRRFTDGWVSGSDDDSDTYYIQGQHLDDYEPYDDYRPVSPASPLLTTRQSVPKMNRITLGMILAYQQMYLFGQMDLLIKKGLSETINNILSEAGAKSFGQTAYTDLFQLVATLMILHIIADNFPEEFEMQWLYQRINIVKCQGEYASKFSEAVQFCHTILNRRPDILMSLQLGRSIQDVIDEIMKQCF